MLGWAIRLLLLLFVLRALQRLWRGIGEGMNPPLPPQPSAVPLAGIPSAARSSRAVARR
jgi:hypothetical protein